MTRNFLKVQCINHARKNDSCCTHGLVRSLAQPSDYAEQFFAESESNSEDDLFSSDDDNSDDTESEPLTCACSACKANSHCFSSTLSDWTLKRHTNGVWGESTNCAMTPRRSFKTLSPQLKIALRNFVCSCSTRSELHNKKMPPAS